MAASAQNILMQFFIAFPIGHKRIVKLPGRSDLIPEAYLVDDIQTVRHVPVTDAGITGSVIL